MRFGRKQNGAAVDFAATLAGIRDELAALDAEVTKVTNARVTRDEATQRIDAALAGATGGWSWRRGPGPFRPSGRCAARAARGRPTSSASSSLRC